jgi:prepilin-type N-terminal cleavage/methylation domain-containing protein
MSFAAFKSLYCSKVARKRPKPFSNAAGFTLLELIVVVLMIAILSAIAAPGWLAFVNRQRVAKVSDAVFSAMQEAQREAKRTKLSYSASFRNNNGVLQVATHRTFEEDGETLIDINSINAAWKTLGGDLEIKPNQVLLCSNVVDANFNKAGSLDCDLGTARTITFDYLGNLAEQPSNGDPADTPLIVTAGIPESNNSNAVIEATQRCVKVKTLIGSMQLGQGKDECDAP